MRDVLITIQKQVGVSCVFALRGGSNFQYVLFLQIKDKLESNAEQHSKLVEEKESLLKNIEMANVRLKETSYETKEKQQKYRHDLDKQVFFAFLCFLFLYRRFYGISVRTAIETYSTRKYLNVSLYVFQILEKISRERNEKTEYESYDKASSVPTVPI